MENDRHRQADRAFTQGPTCIGKFTLRPISAASRTLALDLGLKIMTEPANLGALPESEAQLECGAMIWLHALPIPQVLQESRKYRSNRIDFLAEVIAPFLFELPVNACELYMTSFESEMRTLAAASFEEVPRPSASGGETPPPN